MKKLVEEVLGEGLESLMGEQVIIFCMNYFYTGRLTGVNEKDIILTDAAIVYETGKLDDAKWKDEQKLSFTTDFYVRTAAIESYCKGK